MLPCGRLGSGLLGRHGGPRRHEQLEQVMVVREAVGCLPPAAGGPCLYVTSAALGQSTNVVTFLIVFPIQNSQNRDTIALQIKLDELLLRTKARPIVGIEDSAWRRRDGFPVTNVHARPDPELRSLGPVRSHPDGMH